jgi:hypothetical protein
MVCVNADSSAYSPQGLWGALLHHIHQHIQEHIMAMRIEITDTFGGEANYSWVVRGTSKATTRRGILKAVKQLAGWPGRVKVDYNYGDDMRISPAKGICQTAFVYWDDNE